MNSFQPLCTRILEICNAGLGSNGRIVPTGSFQTNAAYPGKDLDNLSRDTLYKPTLVIGGIQLSDKDRLSENASVALYDVQIVIEAAYSIPASFMEDERTALNAQMATDVHILRRALGNPENLAETQALEETGLCSGMLEFVSAGPPLFDATRKVAINRLTFSGIIQLDYV